jgi:hypothetical protein
MMYWNSNAVLSDHCVLPEFLAEPKIDTTPINETDLQPRNM